jgi:hypothetical protein
MWRYEHILELSYSKSTMASRTQLLSSLLFLHSLDCAIIRFVLFLCSALLQYDLDAYNKQYVVRLEGLGQLKNPMTSSAIEPASFRLVA